MASSPGASFHGDARRRRMPLPALAAVNWRGRPVTTAYVNRIAIAVPPHDVHDAFQQFAKSLLNGHSAVFDRMAKKSGIEHRYSFLAPSGDPQGPVIDREGFYVRGSFPSTADRMRYFEAHASELAAAAIERLA